MCQKSLNPAADLAAINPALNTRNQVARLRYQLRDAFLEEEEGKTLELETGEYQKLEDKVM